MTGQRQAADADLGPVHYLATLIGTTDDETMRWFILAVALLLDPAAVLLLLAAARASCSSGVIDLNSQPIRCLEEMQLTAHGQRFDFPT